MLSIVFLKALKIICFAFLTLQGLLGFNCYVRVPTFIYCVSTRQKEDAVCLIVLVIRILGKILFVLEICVMFWRENLVCFFFFLLFTLQDTTQIVFVIDTFYEHQSLSDGINCGVYVCYYFWCLLKNFEAFRGFDFSWLEESVSLWAISKFRSDILIFLNNHLVEIKV